MLWNDDAESFSMQRILFHTTKPAIKVLGSGKGNDDEIGESDNDSDPEVRLPLGGSTLYAME